MVPLSQLDLSQIPVWTGYLTFITVFSAAFVKWVVHPVKTLVLIARDWQKKIAFIESQFYNNGGSTLKDSVDKLKSSVEAVSNDVRIISYRQQAIVLTDSLGMYEVDSHGYVTFVNPAWCDITGLSEEEALGLGWMQAVPFEDRHKILEGRADGTYLNDYTGQFRFQHPGSDEIVHTIVRFKWNRDSEGKPVGGLGTVSRMA